MNKLLLIFLFIPSLCFATTISNYTWSTNDVVTSVKLNTQESAVSNVVNGNLDNTNMASGYFLFQSVAALPSAGTQGRVDFLTSDNSINLDNGASWLKTITPSGALTTGNIPYYNGTWQQLSPGAQYLPLVSNGTSSLPSYQSTPTQGGGTGVDSSAWTSGDYVYMSGTGTWNHKTIASFGVPTNIQVFTTTGTWTQPAGVTSVYVKVWGSGGGGGGNSGGSTGYGSGGGSGGYAEGIIAVTGNVTVTVDAGGAGGNTAHGTSGGTTSFAGTTTIQATGGLFGAASTNTASIPYPGGAGGVGSNGTINLTGFYGPGGSVGPVTTQYSLFSIGQTSSAIGTQGGISAGGTGNTNTNTGGQGGSGMVIVSY